MQIIPINLEDHLGCFITIGKNRCIKYTHKNNEITDVSIYFENLWDKNEPILDLSENIQSMLESGNKELLDLALLLIKKEYKYAKLKEYR